MKEQALQLARSAGTPEAALNLLREYVQALVLRSLHESEAAASIAFVGGTALRFLHNLPRFSENLDFSLVSPDGYDGKKWLAKVKRDLALNNLPAELTWNDRKTVNTAWIRIAGLLHDAGLSAYPDQKLSIKLEIDTRPPAGAVCERTIVTRNLTFLVQHYNLPSLFAGKLHALICRAYPKGRDWFDLIWYRSKVPPQEPNLPFLQNAFDQTNGAGTFQAAQWRQLVRDRLETFAMDALLLDVRPFLERKEDAALFEKNAILKLL
ncbi:MAG: nucleotidyl transferase AbiEii/AbiGii toxin family protein [Opitutaceae bacterium]|jgi:hypothetical protein|nr:nucleotidyl transferase AbiEii/AbiGii toxin family protein [Opitutaceae bacterium]